MRNKIAVAHASGGLVTGPQLDQSVASIGDQPFTLAEEGTLLALYYDGARVPSPAGGFLMALGVRPEDDGSGSILLECNSSSLRYEMSVPKATRSERKRVRDMIAEGDDPKCPRHQGQLLTRIRHDLACTKCGVRYAKAK